MGGLIALALKIGIAPKFAKAAVIAALVFGTLTMLGVAKCTYDRNVIEKHEARIQNRARPATDKAADERARDTIQNARNEQERHDVIAAQPDQPIAPTSRALACKRLSDAGKHPPACR
jgi:hypothetical protein